MPYLDRLANSPPKISSQSFECARPKGQTVYSQGMTISPHQDSERQAQATQETQGTNARTWTPAQRQRSHRKATFLRALQEHGSLGAACLASGVNDVTVWRWRKQYPAFDLAVIQFVEGVREQRLVESMYRIAMSEDPRTANAAAKAGEFLLKVWNRDKFGDRQKVEQTITINQQMDVTRAYRAEYLRQQQAAIQALSDTHTLDG